jgi:hypothetical protein
VQADEILGIRYPKVRQGRDQCLNVGDARIARRFERIEFELTGLLDRKRLVGGDF